LIQCLGDLAGIKIGGDIIGGAGGNSGQIDNTTSILESLTVRGSMIGGVTWPLLAGAGNDAVEAAASGDVTAREV
jgi:hypothetical protein